MKEGESFMSFADNLRNIKPVTPTEEFSHKVQYMCNLISIDDIKRECIKQAQNGKHSACVKYECFYIEYGTNFSIDFKKKYFFKAKNSTYNNIVEKLVQETLGAKAKSLGLYLRSVNCEYSSNRNAPSSYKIQAVFDW